MIIVSYHSTLFSCFDLEDVVLSRKSTPIQIENGYDAIDY